jgi:hypothetical protein
VDLGKEMERLSQKRSKVEEQRRSVAENLDDLVSKGKGHTPKALVLQVKVFCCNFFLFISPSFSFAHCFMYLLR